MFSLAVLFFCQTLMQFLKDAISLSTGNTHHTVGIKQPAVQWLLQCLQGEPMHLLPGAFWGVWLQGLAQRAQTAWDCSVHELQGSTLQAQGA